MKCKNCGNDIKDGNKFCVYCGSSINETTSVNESKSNSEISSQPKIELYYDNNEPRIVVNVENIIQSKSKKRRSILFSIIFCVSFIGILIFAVKYINSFDYRKSITIGKDEIATIYGALGYKERMCSYTSKSSPFEGITIMDYCDNTLDTEQLEEYEEYLVEKEGFHLDKDSKVKELKKDSLDVSYEIKVSIDYNDAIIIYERIFIPKNNVNNGDNSGNLEA